jgi:hypothetical protein
MEPIKLINDRVIYNRFLRLPEKVAEDAIKRLYEATEWAQASMAAAQEQQKRYINRNRDPAFIYDGRRGPRKRSVLRMLLEDYLRCSGGLAKQATGRKLVVCTLCTHRPGGASIYKPGDMVWLDLRNIRTSRISKKLDWTHGRYRVVKKISLYAYELDVSGKIHSVFYVDLFRPNSANPRLSQVQNNTRPGFVLVDNYEEYAVEKILNVYTKGKHKKGKAIVKWISYAKSINKPLEFVKNTDAYEEFLRLKKEGR